MADNIGGLKDNAIVPVPPFLSSVPSRFPHLVEPQRWRQNLHSDLGMANMQRTAETETEKRERQQRELEQMRQAIADYKGPVTICPRGKSTSDPYGLGKHRQRPHARARNGDGR